MGDGNRARGFSKDSPPLHVRELRARAVTIPLDRPIETAAGRVTVSPGMLIDLQCEEGVTGHAYVFCYTPLVLGALLRLLADVASLVQVTEVGPGALKARLERFFRVLGTKGLVGMVACRSPGISRARIGLQPSNANPLAPLDPHTPAHVEKWTRVADHTREQIDLNVTTRHARSGVPVVEPADFAEIVREAVVDAARLKIVADIAGDDTRGTILALNHEGLRPASVDLTSRVNGMLSDALQRQMIQNRAACPRRLRRQDGGSHGNALVGKLQED